ncbi:MAG TPA: SpoIIE family protein phosphatase, partial [Tenuifilaceae bacterium]|nr:SpoIIE family protein phosphatase [Tenuifilaceae bacterium]
LDCIPVINQGAVTIDQPSLLVCYTDGLVEIMRNNKVEYNTQVIEQEIVKLEPISTTIQRIAESRGIKNDGSSNPEIFDDISILGFGFNCC